MKFSLITSKVGAPIGVTHPDWLYILIYEYIMNIPEEEIKEVLWGIALSDHLGDVADAIEPILKRMGIPLVGTENLLEELKQRGLAPKWAKEL